MTAPKRIAALDIARGAAIFGMFFYHGAFDLAYFGLVDPGFPFNPPMRLYSHAVACAFLIVSGAALALAHRARVSASATWRRMAMLGAACAAITAATYAFAPTEAIWFGILHCLTAAALIGLALLRAPAPVGLVLGAALLLAPAFAGHAIAWPQWLGLSGAEPDTLDWRPLAPWGGVFILALSAARTRGAQAFFAWLAQWRPGDFATRTLAFCGRHSLAVYLIHQPVFFAALLGFFALTGRL